jgi:hypothetical protein
MATCKYSAMKSVRAQHRSAIPPTNLQYTPGDVTHDSQESGLPGGVLRTPSEVTRVQSQGSVLDVSTSSSDLVNSLGRVELGHGRLSTELELSLLSAGERRVNSLSSTHDAPIQIRSPSSRTSSPLASLLVLPEVFSMNCHSLVSPSGTRSGALVARISSNGHSRGYIVSNVLRHAG